MLYDSHATSVACWKSRFRRCQTLEEGRDLQLFIRKLPSENDNNLRKLYTFLPSSEPIYWKYFAFHTCAPSPHCISSVRPFEIWSFSNYWHVTLICSSDKNPGLDDDRRAAVQSRKKGNVVSITFVYGRNLHEFTWC